MKSDGRNQDGGPFLAMPPFPKRRLDGFALTNVPAPTLTDGQADELIRLLAEKRLGGAFWGARPPLPDMPYTLVAGDFADHSAPPSEGLRWIDSSADARLVGARIEGRCDPWHMLSGASAVICRSDDRLRLIAAIVGVPVALAGTNTPAQRVGEDGVRSLLREQLGPRLYQDPFGDGALSWAQVVELLSEWRCLIDGNRELAAFYGFAGWKRATTEPLLWDGALGARFDRDANDIPVGEKVAVWKSRTRPAVLEALERRGAEIVEVEDGFIRSAGLGADCVPPQSIVIDDIGVHFDARRPSRLEQILQNHAFDIALLDRARKLRDSIRALGISKYDVGTVPLERRSDKLHVLVPGQVEDDRAVLSTPGEPLSNLALLEKARASRPDAHIIYKPHPDVEAGHRKGGMPDPDALRFADEVVRAPSISSWIDLVDEVHVNSSLAGFEALMRDRAVTTYGVPFYAGWGLTDDRGPVPPRRTARRSMEELVAATLIVYPRYVDPVTNLPCSPEQLIARLSDTPSASFSVVTFARRLQGQLMRRLAALSVVR